MERLYDENDKYNDVGNQVDIEVHNAIRPIIDKWVKAGYSPRDIQNVAQGAVLENVLTHLLNWSTYAR